MAAPGDAESGKSDAPESSENAEHAGGNEEPAAITSAVQSWASASDASATKYTSAAEGTPAAKDGPAAEDPSAAKDGPAAGDPSGPPPPPPLPPPLPLALPPPQPAVLAAGNEEWAVGVGPTSSDSTSG
ncbi:unnamed protein product, partial [Sphacelaria rigidula]